jgi:SPOR domain
MINIRPITQASDAPAQTEATAPPLDSASAAAPSEPGKQRIPLVWIPATLCVGLLIAAVYLGGRILTAHSNTQASVKAPTVQTPPPVQTPSAPVQAAAPVVTVPDSPRTAPVAAPPVAAVKANSQSEPAAAKVVSDQQASEQVPMIAPKAGERYIQVGALDLERTRHYLARLHQANLEPHVAPGPTPELLRVLIGPFPDHDSLASTQSQLVSAGIQNFVRQY